MSIKEKIANHCHRHKRQFYTKRYNQNKTVTANYKYNRIVTINNLLNTINNIINDRRNATNYKHNINNNELKMNQLHSCTSFS